MAKTAKKTKLFQKTKVTAKAKTKTKPPTKAETPDWLRKAMAEPAPRGRPFGSKNKPKPLKTKLKAIAQKGRKRMAISKDKPLSDPMDDPDLRAGTKGDAPIIGDPPKPPGFIDPKPPARPGVGRPPDNTLPEGPDAGRPDNALPGQPGAHPDNEPVKPRRKPRSGDRDEIDADKVENVIADTLGGSGDQHARARQILDRFDEAGWIISAGEGEPSESIQVILDSTEEQAAQGDSWEAVARRAREEEARRAIKGKSPEALRQALEGGGEEKAWDYMEGRGGSESDRQDDDPKGADAGKGRSKDDPKGADDGKGSGGGKSARV